MSPASPLNGKASSHPRSPADRRADETLHDFLFRKHDEMGAQLTRLRAQVVTQEFLLAHERRSARRRLGLVIGAETLAATAAVSVCWITLCSNLPQILLTVAAASLLGGAAAAICTPGLKRSIRRIGSWRRR